MTILSRLLSLYAHLRDRHMAWQVKRWRAHFRRMYMSTPSGGER